MNKGILDANKRFCMTYFTEIHIVIAHPFGRSFLFLSIHNDKFVEKAHTRGADAYILDL